MSLWLLGIGLLSILAQVVLLRELLVTFFGSELVYVLALGVWLFWTATGAAVARWGRREPARGAGTVRALFLAAGVLLVADVILLRGAPDVLGWVLGVEVAFPIQVAVMAGTLLPVGVVLGLLFPWTARLWIGGHRTLARAYALESAGAVAGGVAATLALRAGLQNLTLALVGAVLFAVVAMLPVGADRPGRRITAATVAILVALLAGLTERSAIDFESTYWTHPFLLAVRDTPYGRTTVTESSGQIVVFQSGALAYESEGTSAEELVSLAALQRPAPRSALVLGGGLEGLVRELQRHAPEHIDWVELDERGFRLAADQLPEDYLRDPDGPPARLVFTDPRRFVEDTGEPWDLVLVGETDPTSIRTNRLFTREFFAACARRMSPDGVVAFRVRSAENLLTPLSLERAASLEAALRASFADVVVVPGVTSTFLASPVPLERDPEVLARRLESRGIHGRVVSPEYLCYLYTNDRFARMQRALAGSTALPNTDALPVCYRLTLGIWLSRFYPALAARPLPVPESGPRGAWWALVVAGAVFMLVRFRPRARRALLAATAGFLGIVLESVLLLDYQTRTGVLYQDLGLLLTLFMAGLTGGAAAAGRAGPARRAAGAGLLVAFALVALASATLSSRGIPAGLAVSAAGLLLAGGLTGALFAFATRQAEDPREAASPLYAADLAGGCLGSLAGGLFLIPAWGFVGTPQALSALALIGTLLL